MRAQTIQIYLPTGNPTGIRQAEVTTRTVRVFDIPRAELKALATFPELSQPGVYFLVGNPDGVDKLYVGESDDVRKRLSQHESAKDFWTRAIVALSLTNTWTKAHVRYLEHAGISLARQSATHELQNGQAGFTAPLPAPLQADCDEFFETIQVLVSTLGYRVMEVAKSEQATAPSERLFVRTGKSTLATGTYDSRGLTIFAKSGVREVSSSVERVRQTLLDTHAQLAALNVLESTPTGARFAKDHTFSSPSAASALVLGRSSNGWIEWKNASGVTLDALERTQGEEDN